jgi:hypothetical protein
MGTGSSDDRSKIDYGSMTNLAAYRQALAHTLEARSAILNGDLDGADDLFAERAALLVPVQPSDPDAKSIAAILQQITLLDDECEALVKERIAAILQERAAGSSARKMMRGYNPATTTSSLEIRA